MTPEEKAEELILKCIGLYKTTWTKKEWKKAKQCALICVDEMYKLRMNYGRHEGQKDDYNYYSYWEDVIYQIKKL